MLVRAQPCGARGGSKALEKSQRLRTVRKVGMAASQREKVPIHIEFCEVMDTA